jgi:hypothetical protein
MRSSALRALHSALLLFCFSALAWTPGACRAEGEIPVPVGLQAELLSKLAAYDRNLRSRAGDRVLVLIVRKQGHPLSARIASQMKHDLAEISDIGGLEHRAKIVRFKSASKLAATIRATRASIVYLSAGLEKDIPAISSALEGVDVLSVAAHPDYVPRGVGAGFDLVSGKPKLLCNLTQARKQNVDFRAEILRLMRVYE